jgi:hypothetical protein
MLYPKEQRILFKMMKTGEFEKNGTQHSDFYKDMKALAGKGLVEIVPAGCNRKIYRLTCYGWCIASCIAKDFDSPPGARKFAKTVEMSLL